MINFDNRLGRITGPITQLVSKCIATGRKGEIGIQKPSAKR